MTPNFALDFRNDHITLLHAQGGGWVQVGRVAVDDPDLETAIGYLRSTALGLAPKGIMSLLVLPDEAILYTTLRDLPETGRAEAIAAALVGRTPYEVADLVYDWRDDGTDVDLAVIARETLDEAESFALQHRFNPVEYVAWPPADKFSEVARFGAVASGVMIAAPAEEAPAKAEAIAPNAQAADFEMGADMPAPDAEPEQTEMPTQTEQVDLAAAQTPDAQEPDQEVIVADAPNEDEAALVPPDQGALDLDAPLTKAEAATDTMAGAETPLVAPEISAPPVLEPAPLEPAAIAPLAQMDDVPASPAKPDQIAAPNMDNAGGFALGDAAQSSSSPEPKPSFAEVMVEEAPMLIDVPIDAPLPDPAPPPEGPSAQKAESLLAAFAARREAALGKGDAAGTVAPRIAPVIPSAKPAPPIAPAGAAPRALAKTGPAKQTAGLGSKPPFGTPAKSETRSVVLGLILTALLLIALALAAAMSSYLTAAWNSDGSADVQTAQAEAAPETPAPTVQAAPPALPDISAAPSLILANRNAPLPDLQTPLALAQPELSAAPPISTASAAPPPIVATKDGVLPPEGVFLIAGRPPLIPAARPEAVITAVAALRPAPAGVLSADPVLQGKKPAARPNGVIAAALQIPSNPALQGKRPSARPEAVLASAARLATASASLVQIAPEAPRSALAVTISRIPQTRPAGFKPPAKPAPEPAVQVAARPSIEPDAPIEADNEPEVVASRSAGPRTVVSQNATYRNALNLSQPNLIGVYGSKTNRYALMRQSNGRIKKLSIGDRFDGGTVAAITDSELRLSKRGQMIAYKMPKG